MPKSSGGTKRPRSLAQNRFMQGVASGAIRGSGVPRSVAREFTRGAHKMGRLGSLPNKRKS